MKDYESTLERLLAGRLNSSIDSRVRQLLGSSEGPGQQFSGQARSSTPAASDEIQVSEAAKLSNKIEQLAALIERPTGAQVAAPTKTASTASKPDGNDTISSVLKTAGMVSGVGPLITGLLGLFGGKKEDPEPILQSFSLPSSVALNAGVNGEGSLTPISYGQSGLARSVGVPQPQAASIHINIQAMDSRSFLDHSDDIARAVREAMLHSHGINDVVAEL
jgi:hypothetical protein